MIASRASQNRAPAVGAALLRGVAVAGVSLAGAGLVALLHEYALALCAFAGLAALTAWRPRYGLYALVFFALAFEPSKDDALMLPGFLTQSDIKSITHLSLLPFTPLELLTTLIALVVVVGATVRRRAPRTGQLAGGIALFLLLLLVSTIYGISRGGSLTIALWEVRSFVVGGALALLLPDVLRERRQVDTLMNLIVLGAVFLSADIVLRRYTLLAHATSADLVSAYAHDTPLVLNFAVVLLIARLVWPASRRQRLVALAIPLLLYAEVLTERRAGWVALDVALLIVVLLIVRLKRRTLFLIVAPLAVVYCGYLGVFWNSTSTIAQPARAVRSITSPDPRDKSSDDYRVLETADIRLNIKSAPLTGLGFGHTYTFFIPLPDLSFWPFWHYLTHNAFLWVWMKMGPAGFVVFLSIAGAAMLRGVQLVRRANDSPAAPVIVALTTCIVMVLVFSYVDVALTSVRICALLGVAIGVIGAWGKSPALIGA